MYDLPPELEFLFFRLQVYIGSRPALRWQTNLVADKPFLSVCVINFVDGIRHRAFLIQRLSIPELQAILSNAAAIVADLAKVEIQSARHLDNDSPIESSNDLPISNRVFFFTDELQSPRGEFRSVLASTKDTVAIIDADEWQRRLNMRKPDAFISYDSRDRIDLVRPLAHALGRLGLIVWYDEFSLKPGDRLSESIDKGLTECRHAILMITDHLLENKTWANTEMSALLTRAAEEPNVLIPVWSKVESRAIKARSARLADIVAIHDSGVVEELASRIYAAVGGAEGALR